MKTDIANVNRSSAPKKPIVSFPCCHTRGGHMGSWRECTRVLGLEGFRVETIKWDGERPSAWVRIAIERRGIRGYECSGCRRRTWRVRDRADRTWDDLPWAAHRVTLVYQQRWIYCRTCGIRTERVALPIPRHASRGGCVSSLDWAASRCRRRT